MARRASRCARRGLGGAGQEGDDHADDSDLRRGARRGALLRLDRRPGPSSRRCHLAAAVHPTTPAQFLVEAERRDRGAPGRRRPDAPGRACRDRTSEGGWALGRSLRRPGDDQGPGRACCGSGRRAEGAGDVRDPDGPEPLRDPLPDHDGEAAGDARAEDRAVRRHARPRRDAVPAEAHARLEAPTERAAVIRGGSNAAATPANKTRLKLSSASLTAFVASGESRAASPSLNWSRCISPSTTCSRSRSRSCAGYSAKRPPASATRIGEPTSQEIAEWRMNLSRGYPWDALVRSPLQLTGFGTRLSLCTPRVAPCLPTAIPRALVANRPSRRSDLRRAREGGDRSKAARVVGSGPACPGRTRTSAEAGSSHSL